MAATLLADKLRALLHPHLHLRPRPYLLALEHPRDKVGGFLAELEQLVAEHEQLVHSL